MEYYRHGTLSLYVALNTKSGEVMGKTATRHISEEFVDVICRGVFTSMPDLRRKLINYITRYNDQLRPIRWRYVDVTRRVTGPKQPFTLD